MRYPAPASTTCSATLSAQLSITAHARRAATSAILRSLVYHYPCVSLLIVIDKRETTLGGAPVPVTTVYWYLRSARVSLHVRRFFSRGRPPSASPPPMVCRGLRCERHAARRHNRSYSSCGYNQR